jgi:hypothetical protein
MADHDSTKAAAIYLLRNGLASRNEVAQLSGRSRQIVAHWAKDYPDARSQRLAKIWQRAIDRKRPRMDR